MHVAIPQTTHPTPMMGNAFALRSPWMRELQGGGRFDRIRLGQAEEEAPAPRAPRAPATWQIAYGVAATASFGLSVFHGYRRHDSLWGGLGWGLLGLLFPIITPAVAFAQGFGERKRR